MHKKMRAGIAVALIGAVFSFAGCGETDADVVSHNLSKAADQFEIPRRVLVVNGITDKYLLLVEGRCSLGNDDPDRKTTITCLSGKDENGRPTYEKHIIRMSDNVVVIAQQLSPARVSSTRYRVIFKPETAIPNFDRP